MCGIGERTQARPFTKIDRQRPPVGSRVPDVSYRSSAAVIEPVAGPQVTTVALARHAAAVTHVTPIGALVRLCRFRSGDGAKNTERYRPGDGSTTVAVAAVPAMGQLDRILSLGRVRRG